MILHISLKKIKQYDREFGMYTLLCIKKIPNKDLLYNTGNSAQYSIEEKGTTEDEMVGWQHPFDGHEFE